MSADNWATCPRCYDEACRSTSIPTEELDALGDYAVPNVDAGDVLTFREDYEFYGAHAGTLIVSYSGACTKCGLALKMKPSTRSTRPNTTHPKAITDDALG